MGNYSMDTCDDGHEQVAFTSHKCPMCALMEEINELKDECLKLEDELNRRPYGD
jgi:hypothetical protein